MKNLLKGSFAVAVALTALSASSNAQTVQVNGLGSSALFLELGLAASSPNPGASCVWSTKTNGIVVATDSSLIATGGTAKTDTGSAFVAWTPVGGSCTTINSTTQIYAYLQTDSVVGDRCLFNGCTIQNNGTGLASANLINSSEVALPSQIAAALNGGAGTGIAANMAGTDIRPEDAEFAMTRATTACGTPVATGSQYLGLGYGVGSTIDSHFSGSTFNVVPFTLPSNYSVTPVGATPIVVVVNGDGTSNSFSNTSITNISSSALASFLDGTFSFSLQALPTPSATGNATTVIIREPISGTYNTMEYNVPNTTTLQTSQDVGHNQPANQQDCSGAVGLVGTTNPMNIATASGGARQRAIGTGQELSQVIANPNSLGYGFWSVANFQGFTGAAAPNAKYLTVDGIEPLLKAGQTHTGIIPLSGSSEIANVTLANVANGTYPIWSLLRLVNIGSGPTAGVTALANAAQAFVNTGATTSRPDFVAQNNLKVVRSHFMPPAGAGEPTAIANGHVGAALPLPGSACTAPELGGDVGGKVFTLAADSTFCTNNRVTTGQTGLRR